MVVFSIPDLFVIVIAISLAIIIYVLNSSSISTKLFALLSFFYGIWGMAEAVNIPLSNSSPLGLTIAFIISRSGYFLGTVLTSIFLLFSISYPYDDRPKSKTILVLVFLEILFFFLYFGTNLMISDISAVPGDNNYAWNYGPLSFLFEVYFIISWIYGIAVLFLKFFRAQNKVIKGNLKIICTSFLVGVVPPSIVSVVFPQMGIFVYDWVGPVSGLIWIIIIAYAIVKHRLFNIKIISIETVISVLWVTILIRLFFATNITDILMELLLLLISIYLGIFIIRNVLTQMQQHEHIESLATDLTRANTKLADLNSHLSAKVAEQTKEIRKSYDLEKKARRELEKLNETKDQFIMITQHHLRTPVTSIRWNLEAMQKGAYGTLSPTIAKAVADTDIAAGRLTRIVDDFLSITAIKTGRQILNIEHNSILPIIQDVLSELKIDIEEHSIAINISLDPSLWPEIDIDSSKIREVLLIILDNAVRYNFQAGKIDIVPIHKNHYFVLSVSSTGIGITKEEQTKIFQSLFYRGESAKKTHAIGMGIGLTVARAVLRAHHGDLTLASKGKDMGAIVTISIPCQYRYENEE